MSGRNRRRYGLLTRGVLGGGDEFSPLDIAGLALWLDASDSSTLFQDSAATTPATADGDVVGGWVDKSGSARNAAQGTGANKPLLKLSVQNGQSMLRFDGSNDYMETISFSQAQPFTILMLLRPLDIAGIKRYIDGNTVNQVVINTAISIYAGSQFVATSTSANGVANTITAVFNGASSFLRVNGVETPAAATPGSNGISDGLTIGGPGNQNAGFFPNFDLHTLLVVEGILPETLLSNTETYLISQTGNLVILIVCDGDSLTGGTGSTAGQTYPAQLLASLDDGNMTVNYGVSGQTILQMESGAATKIDANYDSLRRENIVVAWGGTNDIIFGADATTTYDRIVTYCTNRRAVGWKVVVCDIIARGNFDVTMNAYKDTVNGNIAANWASFADAYVALSDNAAFDDPDDTTYYTGDKIHLNNTGYGIVASLVQDAIVSLST